MKARFHILLLSWIFTLVVAERVSYGGYKAFRVTAAKNIEQIRDQLSSFGSVSLGCEKGHSNHLDIAIPPQSISDFEALGLQVTVISDDLGADFAIEGAFEPYISKNRASFKSGELMAPLPDLSWFNTYHNYTHHRGFFEDLHAAIPTNSEIFVTGKSYQGRDIYGIHFWGKGGKGMKPAIYFHATVHAREWIAAPVQEYLAWQLISGYLSDYDIREIVDKYDFYMIPFVNPDGFVYTQSKDRLWRKNRQPRKGTSCVGTDGNRNWPYKWEVEGGASTEPCSEIYKGKAPGDTPEIKAIVDFTKNLTQSNDIKLFVDFHSYGQYILLPYGYDCDAVAGNNKTQMKLAGEMAHRIFKVNGTQYTYGPSCSTLYPSTGTSPDYMAGKAGAEFTWTIELRPGWNGASGFVLPPQEIQSTAQEVWEGIKYVLETM
ncbi:Peptidase-M14 domain-containing protein [Fusarium falciforme]|uniref:Peptidase-M14 domain-containing protein n=1 Tax=Fusarium falciforme TaxID=195108 RepID=UPI00230031C9|nr:Peptidase-M14 domain-containing protein [Fusarium falciforme]WAO95304.1 Peptidase-M14 domain-containing protein [Fusarium falciforme]